MFGNAMNLEVWKFIVCLIAVAIAFALIGIRLGKGSGIKPTSGGVIDFEKREDGSIGCIFKLEGDVDWIAKQKFIILEVHNGDKI